MIYHYVKTVIRTLLRQKSYSVINIAGLSIGIAAFILIFLFVQYELGFNRHIADIENLYRCVEIQHAPGVGEQHVAVTMGPLGKALEAEFPEVEQSVRYTYWGSRLLEYNDQFFEQDYVLFADPSIFEMFSINLVAGDTATALKETSSIVISENMAKKIFGSVEQAMGKIIKSSGNSSFTVTAIMENQPKQSHVRMEALISFEVLESKYSWLKGWGSNSLDTYVRLKDGTDVAALSKKFPGFIKSHTDDEDSEWIWELYLQPVSDIHLKSGHIKFQIMNFNQGNIYSIYIFSIISVLILLLACVNFINLAIAQSVSRAREVGLRKVVGANNMNLIFQFIGESAFITLFSIVMALLLVEALLPAYNNLLGTDFTIDFAGNYLFSIGLILLFILVSIISGSYPAFYLSRFQPIKVLKSGIGTRETGTGLLTKGLVVFQFAISVGMIFSIAVIYNQFNFALNKDKGINYTNVISVGLYDKNDEGNVQFLKNEFIKNSNVLDVAFVSDINGVTGSQGSIRVDDTTNQSIVVRFGSVDYNFFEMMDIPIIEGRNFSRDFAMDQQEAVILNRVAVEMLGWDNAIGKTFEPIRDTVHKRTVIGVIEDYHYYSIHSKIEPAVYLIDPSENHVLAVKIQAQNQDETIAQLEEIWSRQFPGIPFDYEVAIDRISREYKNEATSLRILSFFTVLSIVISCLGLYGLTALMIERRVKEIGIRKVFGGSVAQIVKLIVKYFMTLVLLAGLIATPVAYFLMEKTLNDFAYRIDISWIYFFGSILLASFIALVTIIYHAVRAALANPVDSLHYE